MGKKLEVRMDPETGTLSGIYSDELKEVADRMGAEVVQVCRASNVEWERSEKESGWTVRAAHDPELAARVHYSMVAAVVPSRSGPLAYFTTREAALQWEVEHFWELLPKEKSNG